MAKTKKSTVSNWTITQQPNHGQKTFRLRWKKMKMLGNPSDPDLKKAHYFATFGEAEDFARRKIEEIQHIGKLAAALEPEERAELLRDAARLRNMGIDPIAAMEEGAKHLKAYGEQAEIRIGEYWDAYAARRKAAKKWGTRNARAQQAFFEAMKDDFMQQPIKNFIRVSSGHEIVTRALEQYRSSATRNAANTIRGAKSKMRTFLFYVAGKVEALNQATLREIFSTEEDLPLGLRPEAANVAISAEQAEYLISYLAARQLAGWIVFKLFMGARTLLVQEWKWSIVDFQDERIIIPKHQTKLKKNELRFSMSEIPNFTEWVKWAWEVDGKPNPEKPIARFSQPTITRHVEQAMNAKRGLFAKDQRKTIKPAESHRNFMRSAFITYGTEIPGLGVGKVMKIAEDAHNLHKYLAWDSATGRLPEAEKFWNLSPDQIVITPPLPHTRRRRESRQAIKTDLPD
jgi:hypothetical protein